MLLSPFWFFCLPSFQACMVKVFHSSKSNRINCQEVLPRSRNASDFSGLTLPSPFGSRTGVLKKPYSGTYQPSTAKVSGSSKRPHPLSSPVTLKFLQSAIVRLRKYPCPADAEASHRTKLRRYGPFVFIVESLTRSWVSNQRDFSPFFLVIRLTSISMAAAPIWYFGISTVVKEGSK